MSEFQGEVALVTGAGSGIGRATALAFAAKGLRVAVADIDPLAGAGTVHAIAAAGGEAIFVQTDVTRSDQVEALVGRVVERFGGLDYAFNNAGTVGLPAPTAECTEDNWDATLAVNLKGVWLCLKFEIPALIARGGGAIVNCSSGAGLAGFQDVPAYVASKHGVIGLTRAAAVDYAHAGIRVNAVCPGVIRTPMVERFTLGRAELEANLVAGEPMGRMGTAEEVAAAVLWLCSDAASFVTGDALAVDGGLQAQGGQRRPQVDPT